MLPRGLRNNNPLNIRHSSDKWQGRAKTQTDPAFVQFVSMAYGYRAAFVLLRTYRQKYGYNTLRKIIGRWAPPSENNTERYLANVSKWSGLDPDKPIAGHDANTYIAIVSAMTRMESPLPKHILANDIQSFPTSPHRYAGGRAPETPQPYTEEWLREQMVEGWRLANM